MEEEIKVEPDQGDVASREGAPRTTESIRGPMNRSRGLLQGSKKLKVCVTDIKLLALVSGISNGGSTESPRGRGRPKLSCNRHTVPAGSGDIDESAKTHKASNGDDSLSDHTPKKRSRTRKSQGESNPKKAAELLNGGSPTPKRGRGRPKGSGKRKSESLTRGKEGEGVSVTPRKRGRPKGSLNKMPRLLAEVSSEGEEETGASLNSTKRSRGRLRSVVVSYSESSTDDAPQRRRGRPRKTVEQEHSDQEEEVTVQTRRKRGRPKGSLNKKPPAYQVHGKVGRPRTVQGVTGGRRGRPRLQPAKRGRPRKYPLPTAEDLKKPRVWKPLGRPRKYPRVDPPEGALPAPRRGRGRPRKSDSKKGAHLRKSLPSSPRRAYDGPPRKRGRPRSTPRSEEVTPRKKGGRPKGSVGKNKGRSETQHSKENSCAPVIRVPCEGEPVEEDEDEEAEETLIKQDDVSDQA